MCKLGKCVIMYAIELPPGVGCEIEPFIRVKEVVNDYICKLGKCVIIYAIELLPGMGCEIEPFEDFLIALM